MPFFNFNLAKEKIKGTKRKPGKKYDIIERNCEGVIIKENGIYLVLYNNIKYKITSQSYDGTNKRTIYAKVRDKFSHRIKIIRDKDSRKWVDTRFYCAICDGLICKGKIIKNIFGEILFHVRVCYNPADVEGTSLALKEWHRYKASVEAGEVDENNEL